MKRVAATPARRATLRLAEVSRIALVAAAVCGFSLACASSFQVNPVRVQLGGANTSEAITVRNTGAEPVVVQASILAWSQNEGDDAYAPTNDALVTPPIATIAAGAEQIVRVGLRRRLQPSRELAFRLFVEEVPAPTAAAVAPVSLRVALRIGLPVFVVPDAGAKPDLHWSAHAEPDGRIRLVAQNAGSAHAQIIAIDLTANGEPLASSTAMYYVLPGDRHSFFLTPPAPISGVSTLRVKAYTDAGESGVDVPLAYH